MKPTAMILFAPGTNRDQDAAQAFELAGANTEIVPLSRLRKGERRWADYQILVLPGGFSYADALGAGKLLALDLQAYFTDEITAFVASGKPVIGICNGFQALVKAHILPAREPAAARPEATLTFNQQGRFECRWVTLRPVSQTCLWTRGLEQPITCPVAHGEGNFFPASGAVLEQMSQHDQIALAYACPDGSPAGGAYPFNPNGSAADIAGVCNAQGNVLGLMPHPENHIYPYQHPRWSRGQAAGSGLPLFQQGVKYAEQC
jgi:phosphoribosylformylglycinamidine synthase subunit PurQ / glutaminase